MSKRRPGFLQGLGLIMAMLGLMIAVSSLLVEANSLLYPVPTRSSTEVITVTRPHATPTSVITVIPVAATSPSLDLTPVTEIELTQEAILVALGTMVALVDVQEEVIQTVATQSAGITAAHATQIAMPTSILPVEEAKVNWTVVNGLILAVVGVATFGVTTVYRAWEEKRTRKMHQLEVRDYELEAEKSQLEIDKLRSELEEQKGKKS